jgi:predicted Zn-dependent protease
MIDRAALERALAQHGIVEWALAQRDQELAIVTSEETALHRTERRTRFHLTVHHDAPSGRGSATLALDARGGDADALVEQTRQLAMASVSTTWRPRPPAAPAQVALEDPALRAHELLPLARRLAAGARGTSSVEVFATAHVLRERVEVATSHGLRTSWRATELEVDALVARGERSLAIARTARRAVDLGIGAAVRGAAADLELLAGAQAAEPGPCTVVLTAEAMLHGGRGVWEVFARQADALLERQGLSRYRERMPIARDAELLDEPLTILSEGALDFALASAPVADDGAAVRTFALVERGRAAGLGLVTREAALRARDPNGGVRNLGVALGATWPGTIEAARPYAAGTGRVLEVRRLRTLAIDTYTGDATLEIELAVDHPRGLAVTGGVLRLDLIDALARARRSTVELRRGSYRGPNAVLLARAELLA